MKCQRGSMRAHIRTGRTETESHNNSKAKKYTADRKMKQGNIRLKHAVRSRQDIVGKNADKI